MTRTKKSAALLKILVIAAILILLPIVTPNMYIMQIINMIGIYIILGIGINVLTGYTGQLSLGQAAFFGIGAYTAALMNTRAAVYPLPAGFCGRYRVLRRGAGHPRSESQRFLPGPADHGLRRSGPYCNDQLDPRHQRHRRCAGYPEPRHLRLFL